MRVFGSAFGNDRLDVEIGVGTTRMFDDRADICTAVALRAAQQVVVAGGDRSRHLVEGRIVDVHQPLSTFQIRDYNYKDKKVYAHLREFGMCNVR